MNRGNVVLAAVVLLGTAFVAYQLWLLIGLYIGDVYPSTPTEMAPNLHPGQADVSALIEEAKRITGESS